MDEDVKEEIHSRESLCRVCAGYTQLLIPIFEREGMENNIAEKIEKHLPVKVSASDILPTQICYQCASTIISWHELKTTCLEAERKLKSMFGKDDFNTSDLQMSPADSRNDDNDVCEELVLDSSHQSADQGPSSPNFETPLKGHPNQSEDTEVLKDGEKERSIADVTEDCNDMVCVEVFGNEVSVKEPEKQFEIDHCYSRERQDNSTTVTKSHNERSQPAIRSVLRPIAPRPILPRPLVNFVQNPGVPSPQKTQKVLKSAADKVFIVLPNREGNATSSENPTLVPMRRLQPITAKNRVSSNIQICTKIGNSSKSTSYSLQPVLALSHPATNTGPLPTLAPPLLKPLNIVKKLSEVTITRVPVNIKKSPVKMTPKASVSVIRGGSYPCKLCPAKFSNEMIFKRHMYLSHNVLKHTCMFCKSAFGTKFDLNCHIRSAHIPPKPKEKEKRKCKVCDEEFEKVLDLRIHSRTHRPTLSRLEQAIKEKKPVVGVPITEKEAEMLRDFYVRENNKDKFFCKLCQKMWGNLEKAVSHVRTHTKELLYSCEICSQRFNTRGVMLRHMQIHQNRKPHKCDYCDKMFSSKQNRDDHHRFHTKEVKTVCESCGDNLTSASMLYYHRKIHSGVNPYKCPYCEKAYSIKSLLKRHIRLHTGEKPHLCSVCGRGFKTSGQLRGHSAVHSDERPFSCDGCGATMKTKKYLNRHKAICPTLQVRAKNTA